MRRHQVARGVAWQLVCLFAAVTARIAAAQAAAPPTLLAPLASASATSAAEAPSEQQLGLPALDPTVPSPAAFLGYPLGERFTGHSDVLAYLQALDAASPRVTTWKYGETYEHRPLELVAISSAANLARLDALRAEREQLRRVDKLSDEQRQRLARELPAVLWLAYGVHGNEASSTEAAMAAAYVLAAARGEGAPDLDHLIVLIDPLVNPDGRERYVQGFVQRRGAHPDPDPAAREHDEPWPGGRGNHYFVDLNRDWAWATQQETRARLEQMNAWEPQVYVDFHEMGAESTYFFPPTAEPVHPAFGPSTRRWLGTFGRANAAAFDKLGWTYYVGEEYDFFYPAYGDTYPTLRGGVGMTYEVAGGGASGSVVDRDGQGAWGLSDRIARHLATTLSTIGTAAQQARALVADFVASRVAQSHAPGRTFLWRDGPEAAELARLLTLHGVVVGRLQREQEVEARPLAGGEPRKVRLAAGTWGVSTAQPLGELAQALLEREATVPGAFLDKQRARVTAHLEPQFYDITAWSLPLAYNLDAWSAERTPVTLVAAAAETGGVVGAGRVGFLLPPAGLASYRFAAALLRQGIPFRLATEPLTVSGRELPAGTLFVPREGRPDTRADAHGEARAALETQLQPLAVAAGVRLEGVESSLTGGGIPLGSERMVPIRKPRIALVAGSGVEATSFGWIWHLLDQEVGASHSVLDVDALGDVDFSRYDVLVLADGDSYARVLGDDGVSRLKTWLEGGGVLVATGRAVDWLHAKRLSTVATHHKQQDDVDPEDGGAVPAATEKVWDTELMVPGAIVATELRRHPLTVGVSNPPLLFWGNDYYDASGDPQQDLLRVRAQSPLLAGVAWPEAKQQLPGSLLMAVEQKGRGKVVVFTQEPAFRLFWRGTMPLVLNAILYAPSL